MTNAGPGARQGRRSPWGAIAYWTAVAAVWAMIFVVALVFIFSRDLPDTTKLLGVHKQPSITYLDRSGSLLGVRGSQYAPPVDLDRLPPYVPAAFVAIEDRRFYHHWGFDTWGIMRALAADLRHGHTVEGASTITQQLARNLFLTPDQTIKRKVQEVMLAVWLEHKFTKKQILALYLNRVYFGGGAYGIEAAAQRFFNKPAAQLSVGEAAMLAGLLKSPTHYSPVGDSERAASRATIVLDKMVETGAITPAQRADAFNSTRSRWSKTPSPRRPTSNISSIGSTPRPARWSASRNEDLVVDTTLDLPLDEIAAKDAVRAAVAQAIQRLGVQQAALVSLDGAGAHPRPDWRGRLWGQPVSTAPSPPTARRGRPGSPSSIWPRWRRGARPTWWWWTSL